MAGVSPAVRATRLLLGEPARLARTCLRLPAEVVRGVLATPRSHDASVDVHVVFLRQAVDASLDDRALTATWKRALHALLAANTQYARQAKRFRQMRQLAEGPFLSAFQAVAAGCSEVPRDYLGVLAADGSAESVDALLPHVHRAVATGGDGLELLDPLRAVAAPTPVLTALFDEVQRALQARMALSPALAWARVAGLGELAAVWLRAGFDDGAWGVSITIDSRIADWFRVCAFRRGMGAAAAWTEFDHLALHSDDLKLGRCEAAELPSWMARAARQLGCVWDDGHIHKTSLRGRKRAAALAWLRGGAPA